MRMIIDVADDISLKKMEQMHEDIAKKYKEYVVEMGWIINGKFIRNKDIEDEKTKKDPFSNMFGKKEGNNDGLSFL